MSHDPYQPPQGHPAGQPFPQQPQVPYQPGAVPYPQQPGQWAPPPPPPKKTKRGLIVGVSIGAILATCLLGAALSNSSDKSQAKTAAVSTAKAGKAAATPEKKKTKNADDSSSTEFNLSPGTVMTITDDDGDAQDAVVFSFKAHTSACNEYSPAPDNGLYLVADVLVTQKKGTGAVNPLYFTWVADDGTTANSVSGAFSSCGSALDSTNSLRAGTKRAGQVVFDVSSTKGSLEYAPGGLGSDAVGSWKSS